MKNRTKRLIQELETLGFYRDETAPTKGIAYRHPNDPSQVVKVFNQMSDNSVTFASRLANKIADTGHQGPRQPQTVKERATITRRKESEARRKEREAREARARKAEAEHEERQRLVRERNKERELRGLMMPGYGR